MTMSVPDPSVISKLSFVVPSTEKSWKKLGKKEEKQRSVHGVQDKSLLYPFPFALCSLWRRHNAQFLRALLHKLNSSLSLGVYVCSLCVCARYVCGGLYTHALSCGVVRRQNVKKSNSWHKSHGPRKNETRLDWISNAMWQSFQPTITEQPPIIIQYSEHYIVISMRATHLGRLKA